MKYKIPKMQLGNIINYQGTKYKDGSTYFQGDTGIHTGKQAVVLPEVSTTPLQSIQNIMNDFKQSPTFKVYEKDKPLSGTDPVGQFIVEGAVLGKPTQYLLDKGLTAAVGSTSGELLNKALSRAKSLYYNKAPWTFKPNQNYYYRAIPREAIDDAIETGVIRHKPKSSKFLDLLELKNSPDPDVASKAAEEFSKLTLTERLNVGSMADSGQTYFLKGKPWTQKYSQRYGQQDYGTYGDYFIEASDKVPFIPIKTKGRLPTEVMKNLEKNYNPEIKGIAIPKANVLPEKTIPLDENVKLYKPNWFYGFKQVSKPKTIPNKNVFKSEINWGKWNPEIPYNTSLLKEYNNIERTAKVNNTWMKNADGSSFKGTPEQFVQQQSSNFKKAFPDGSGVTYRGDYKHYPELDYNPIFTGDKETALNYTTDNASYWSPFHDSGSIAMTKGENTGGLHELYYKNNQELKINAKNRDWADLNVPEINKAKTVTTDDVQNYIAKYQQDYLGSNRASKLKNAIIENVYDNSFKPGTVRILPHVDGNYLKSARGNNGMFDMTNPNIYKTITGISAGLGALKLNKQ